MKEKTLLVIAPSSGVNCPFYLLVAETGECLYSHFCSHEGYALGDLYEDKPDRKEEIKKRFGEVDVVRLDRSFIGVDEMIRRNQEWHKKQEEME